MSYVGTSLQDAVVSDTPGMGHNAPPLDQLIVEQFEDKLDAVEGLRKRIKDLCDKDGALPDMVDEKGNFTAHGNEEAAGKMGDLIKMVGAAGDRVEAIRVDIKAPYLEATRALDGKAKSYDEALDRVRRQARGKLNAYVAAVDKKRRDAEQAERERIEAERAAEIEAAKTNAPAGSDELDAVVSKLEQTFARPSTGPAPTKSEPIARGDYGARVGTRSVWKAEIVDVKKLPKAVLDHPKVVEAILSVLNQQAKSGIREIKGAKVFEVVESSVR